MRNKKLFTALLALFTILPMSAYDFIVDGVAYNVTSAEEQTVEVTAGDGNGFYRDNVIIPPTVIFDEITYTVTAIGERAFYFSLITSISLPPTIRLIKGCFYYCNQLKSLTIPEGVETINDFAISDCNLLESVSLPSTLNDFRATNFQYCKNLRTVTVAPDNPIYDSRDDCNAIIETKTNTLHRGCAGTTIPNTVTAIDKYSLSYTTIDSLFIPESVKTIGRSDYFSVDKLYFNNWESFCGINYNGSIYRNWEKSFGFSKLYINNQLVEGDITFPNTVKGCDLLRGYGLITSLHIPSSFDFVTQYAFQSCYALKIVTFDDGATIIGEEAFSGCRNLTTVKLPLTMKTISSNAFSGCSNLKSFLIPANVMNMGSNVFYNCRNLVTLIVEAHQPPTINDDTFSEDTYSIATLYVPAGTKSLYEQADGWKNFQMIVDDEEPNEEPNEKINRYFAAGGLYYHVTSVKDMEVEVVDYSTYSVESVQDKDWKNIEDTITTIIDIPAKVSDKENGFTFTVTGIGGSSFGVHRQFVNAKSIRIPKTVKKIGHWAIHPTLDIMIEDLSSWCKIDFVSDGFPNRYNNFSSPYMNPYLARKLYLNNQLVTDLAIPDGVTAVSDAAFYGFKSIKSVTFAPCVKYIGVNSFNHTSLEKVVIPSTMERIGTRAFSGCFDLKELIIENGVTEIGAAAFGDCLDLQKVSIPASVKLINNFAFRCCKSLKELTLADGVGEIGEWAFTQCEALETVSVPKSVKVIGRHAFNGCKSLKNVNLSEGLESIDRYAFTNCSSLKSLSLPASVSYVGRNVVEDCSHLESLTIAANNANYDSRNGGNIIYETATNTIVAVAPNADIPQGAETIGDYAFSYCSDRQSVILPESVKTLGNYAFLHCWSLHTITIPEGVNTIGYRTFDSCEGIESVVAMSEEPCQMDDEAFTPRTYKRAILYVPDGAEERYRNADGCKNFAKIEGHTDWQLGIETIADNETGEPIIKTDGHRVLLSNLSANERINVYRLNGTLVKAVNAAPDGKAIVVLPESGVYVIRTMTTAKKVVL